MVSYLELAGPHVCTVSPKNHWNWFASADKVSLSSGFDKITLSAYTWISENYREGDRIYLFGTRFISLSTDGMHTNRPTGVFRFLQGRIPSSDDRSHD